MIILEDLMARLDQVMANLDQFPPSYRLMIILDQLMTILDSPVANIPLRASIDHLRPPYSSNNHLRPA